MPQRRQDGKGSGALDVPNERVGRLVGAEARIRPSVMAAAMPTLAFLCGRAVPRRQAACCGHAVAPDDGGKDVARMASRLADGCVVLRISLSWCGNIKSEDGGVRWKHLSEIGN
eukprot:scaffold192727_cov31-Tisochrysis_lutea.AAC.5